MPASAIRTPVVRAIHAALRDGTPAIIRPARPDDAQHAQAFFHWLSDETRYLRFMYHATDLTPEMITAALAQDGLKRVSLVVEPVVDAVPLSPVLGPALPEPSAIALGRYAPADRTDTCEIALTVGDAWQARGVGRVLLKRLIALARRGGYGFMCAMALSDNAKMIRLAKRFGFEVRDTADGVTTMRLEL